MALDKILYTAHATSTGGRDGGSKSDDGKLQVKLAPPKEMGGNGDGTNPEQLFAAGYSACFLGALKFVAGKSGTRLPSETNVTAKVSFGPRDDLQGFGLEVALTIHVPGLEHAAVEKLAEQAHIACPYSHATRNNIPVTLQIA